MKLKETTLLFNALSDETRLRILNLLTEGELCVCDLMSVLKVPQSKVSRHLAYLRRAKVVECRKQGLWMYYRLSRPKSKLLQALLDAVNTGRSELGELRRDLDAYRKSKACLVACCRRT